MDYFFKKYGVFFVLIGYAFLLPAENRGFMLLLIPVMFILLEVALAIEHLKKKAGKKEDAD